MKKLFSFLSLCIALALPTVAWATSTIALASAARTTTTNCADTVKVNERSALLFMNVIAVPGIDTVSLGIQAKDASGAYFTIASTTASAAAVLHELNIVPGAPAIVGVSTAQSGYMLPDTYRCIVI